MKHVGSVGKARAMRSANTELEGHVRSFFGGSRWIEFFLLCPDRSDRAVELLAMVAHYHATVGLDLHHTVPIGEPWLPGASCDHFLVSLPYPFGPSLEVARCGGREHGFLWLLPITAEERDFQQERGLEELEQLFEVREVEYRNPGRRSLVP